MRHTSRSHSPRFQSLQDFWRKNFGTEPLSHIPGALGSPVVGDTLRFLRQPTETFAQKIAQYGEIFKMRLFGETIVFLTGAEANRFALIEQARYMSSREGWNFSIGELFHGGVMLRDGDDHKHHRSILQAAFKKEPLAAYLKQAMPIIEAYLHTWEGADTLRIFPAMKALTLQIAGKVFFGVDFSDDLERVNRAIIDVVKASSTLLPLSLPFTTYRRGLRARRVLEEYFAGIIRTRRQHPTEDILVMLCQAQAEDGSRLSDQEIIDHLIFLLMAGHDTTASTLTSLFYELAKHPEIQAQLREESLAFHAEQGNLNAQNITMLRGLDYATKETLRLHPPLILIPRKTSQELQFGKYILPKNTAVSVLIYHNHYDHQYFADATEFVPERFASPRAEHKKCPHAYAPFGAGQHHCLGYAFAEQQIRAVMHQALRRFRWHISTGYQAPYRAIPIQEPIDGLPLKIEKMRE